MRILITGVTGFLGAHFLTRLASEQDDIAVLLRPEANHWRVRHLLDRVHRINGDLKNIEASSKEIKAFAPDTVVHLAWAGVGNRFRNDLSQLDANLFASLDLLKIAHEAGVRTWIGFGSQAEYGRLSLRAGEETPTRPTTLYGATKLSTCLLSQQLCQLFDMRFAWFRVFSSYGPMDDTNWMIPQLILSLLEGKRPALTPGTQRWDYVYASDVAEAIYLVLKTPNSSGIFNLGSGEARPLREIVERIRDSINPSLPLGFGEIPFREDQVMHLEADISRLQQSTGWSPRVSLEEGILKTVEWYRDHRADFHHGPG